MSLTQLYLTELLSTDVQHAALVAASQVCLLAIADHSMPAMPHALDEGMLSWALSGMLRLHTLHQQSMH